jgi:hypothetical protein
VKQETSARLAIEIADHHMAGTSVEKRRDLARAIVNAIGICERELTEALIGRSVSVKVAERLRQISSATPHND